jgi:hypothetical protein
MENFICKEGEEKQEYKGYIIVTTTDPISCRIFEEISPNKFKKRREVMGANTGKCDQFGNKLFKKPTSLEQLVTKAKSFIDNHIVKWNEKSKPYTITVTNPQPETVETPMFRIDPNTTIKVPLAPPSTITLTFYPKLSLWSRIKLMLKKFFRLI